MQSTGTDAVTRALDKLSSIAAAFYEISDEACEAANTLAAVAAERDQAIRVVHDRERDLQAVRAWRDRYIFNIDSRYAEEALEAILGSRQK